MRSPPAGSRAGRGRRSATTDVPESGGRRAKPKCRRWQGPPPRPAASKTTPAPDKRLQYTRTDRRNASRGSIARFSSTTRGSVCDLGSTAGETGGKLGVGGGGARATASRRGGDGSTRGFPQ